MNILEKAEKIRLVVLDVDGVLTDGGIYYNDGGKFLRRFNVQDGLGIKLAQAAGLELAVISGLDSGAVKTRVQELGITDYYPGQVKKLPVLERILADKGLSLEDTAFLGDDWVDASCMLRVGLPMAVCNARPEIRRIAAWISRSPGGHGAVREAISFILEARGILDSLWRSWAEI